MMNAAEERKCREWYNWKLTPENIYMRRTRWNNLHTDWVLLEVAASYHYEQYYNERRAREQRILPDGVAQ